MTDFKTKEINYDIEGQVESFHWWFVGRRKLLETILTTLDLSPGDMAIEIGCGAGSNLNVLNSKKIRAIGLDQSSYALSLVKTKLHLPLINGDLNDLPIQTNSMGLMIAMDVLEHLENDTIGIAELYRALKNGGTLILTIPAFKSLWGIQDTITGHKRRYSLKEISEKLRMGGFSILKLSYFNFFLFFPIFFTRRLIHLLKFKIESENRINSPLLNYFLKTIFSLEPYLLRYISFPFGVSIFCVARKG
jgi:ubiquinone/menaquinone biosynthesis C-methylase UbiE